MAGPGASDPIFHLSISVSDRAATRSFYVDLLGGEPGRAIPGEDWFDVWLWGAQVTFHEWPDTVLPERLTRGQHFGATLPRDAWDETHARLEAAGADFAKPARYDPETGTAKMYVRDPDGTVIELKAYDDPAAALRRPDAGLSP